MSLAVLLGASFIGFNAATVEMLIAARIAAGLAVGILSTVILSSLSATGTSSDRGKIMSLFHVANNVGIAAYPLLGGAIGAVWGWRATFAVTAGLSLAAARGADPGARARASPRRGNRSAPPRTASASSTGDSEDRHRVDVCRRVANMVNRHGFRNTILPLYAATSLGLAGSRSRPPSR